MISDAREITRSNGHSPQEDAYEGGEDDCRENQAEGASQPL